jgi:glycine/D-amino acid oxidase-like deaminating enzyme
MGYRIGGSQQALEPLEGIGGTPRRSASVHSPVDPEDIVQFHDLPSDAAKAAVSDLSTTPFWLDDERRPAVGPALSEGITCDLLVIGAGFTGLWAALLATGENPGRDVVLVDSGRIAGGATGRNGGFMSHSLTHGIANGMGRWPSEMATLSRMGRTNLDAIAGVIEEHRIDCDFWRCGELTVAVQPSQVASLEALVRETPAEVAGPIAYLNAEQVRGRIASPTYLAAVADPDVALVNPAALAWGLARACREAGVRIFENSAVDGLRDAGDMVQAQVNGSAVCARRVAVATNAYPPLLRTVRRYVVPVYDYVIVTEPLSEEQWSGLGWTGREGVGDAGNQFHYYRPTSDGRILWGGYDAIYHRGNGFGVQYEADGHCFGRLAEHFRQTFPSLDGIRFTHGWGGAIDTCTRFSPFWGQAHAGKTVYVAGYTGLGVGSSRFGAAVMLDLLDGRDTERTRLAMVRSKPIPFPPEPVRSIGIDWTVRSLRAADRNGGKRNLWLRTLDRLGMGFDS